MPSGSNESVKKTGTIVVTVLKWVLVLFFLWPLQDADISITDFTRIVIGILLFILFAGKLFYDIILERKKNQKPVSAARELLNMVAIVSVLALAIAGIVAILGMVIYTMLQQSAVDPAAM